MKRTAQCFVYLLSTVFFTNLSFAQDTVQVVTAWLNKNSFPIQTIEPTDNFSDLKPLKAILQEVRVIGLGESTHGTREFFQMKHRLVRFLVTEMGYTAFAIEASNTACQPINDYILTGKGERATVLTGQGYMAWDTEEFAAMLDWMRAYNQNVPDAKKVKFYGMDVLCCHGLGREKVLAYLQEYAPGKVAATESLFQMLAVEDEKWPTRLNQDTLQQAFIPLHALVSYFLANKEKLVSVSSLEEWKQTFRYLEVMEGGLFANVNEIPASLSHLKQNRSESMAKNLFYLMDKEKPAAKFMVWAHNYHISTDTAEKTTGHYLQERLGNNYYALGFDCKEGTFQSRVLLPDGYWGELQADTIVTVQKRLSWYLSQFTKKNAFINLRAPVSHLIVKKWLETPISVNSGWWKYRGADQNHEVRTLKGGYYDGIVYIERSTPVSPTKNALTRSANKIGF